jgi:uncharacterized protein with HEPN domain
VKQDRTYLEHILDAIAKVEQYTTDGRDAFMADGKTQDAVVRNLEIIGEATKRVSEDLRNKYPDIPWKQAAGLRDVLSHDYMSIDLTIVWNVIDSRLPALREAVRELLTSGD